VGPQRHKGMWGPTRIEKRCTGALTQLTESLPWQIVDSVPGLSDSSGPPKGGHYQFSSV
jgi:hypothetical protein